MAAVRKTLLVTNIPTPYRIPLFNELSAGLRDQGWHLKVVFAAPTYARRNWKLDEGLQFDHEVLGEASRSHRPIFTYPGLLGILGKERPDVVISAGFSAATLKVWLWSMLSRVPFYIWSGSISAEENVLRRLYRMLLVRSAAGAVCYGSRARTYMARLGVKESNLHTAINTVDVAFFRERTAMLRASRNREGPARILYLGDLIHRKRVDLLLHGIQDLAKRRRDFVLDIVGDGPLARPLQRLADDLGIRDLVRFEGYRQKDELPHYFARASAFVFPTQSDVWGLVLIEAMAAGLPCIASVHAGATADVIQEGVNGFAVRFDRKDQVAERLAWILENPDLAEQMGRAASKYVTDKLSLSVSAGGFVGAVVKQMERLPARMEAVYDIR